MIIKGGAVSCKSGTSKTASHIFEGPTNERIEALQGNAEDMKDMLNDARLNGLKYAFEHFKISPEKEITRGEAYKDFQAIATEYGFNLSDAVIVEHRKARQGDENSPIHWHMIAPYLNPETGKAVDLKNNYARNEKLSRLSEIRTGQTLIKGQHNEAVFFALQKEGKTAEAEAMKHLVEGDLPSPSYSQESQQKAARKGINLPSEKNNIKDIYKLCDGMKSFKSALAENGYSIEQGRKDGIYIITKDGNLIGSANRLLLMKKEVFKKEFENDTTSEKSSIAKTNNSSEHTQGVKRDGEKSGDDIGISGTARESRRKSSHDNFAGNTRQSNSNDGNDERLAKEINNQILLQMKKLQIELKKEKRQRDFDKNRNQSKKEIRNYLRDKNKDRESQDDIQRMIEIIFNRLFGIPTKYQINSMNRLINSGKNGDIKPQTLDFIVKHELQNLVKISPNSSEEEIKKIYQDQKNFINELNKRHKINLQNPSFGNFLINNKGSNPICDKLLEEEKKQLYIDKIDNLISKKFEITQPLHLITDIKTIQSGLIKEPYERVKKAEKAYDDAMKSLGNMEKVGFWTRIFNRQHMKDMDQLKEKIEGLKGEVGDRNHDLSIMSRVAPDRAKSISEQRIKENQNHEKDWKTKVSKDEIIALNAIKERVRMGDESTINSVAGSGLFSLLDKERERITQERREQETLERNRLAQERIDANRKASSKATGATYSPGSRLPK